MWSPISLSGRKINKIAADQDAIIVLTPEYAGNITINKSITLKGANAGVNPNTQERSNESIITGKVSITANNIDVALDGIKFTETGNIAQDGSVNAYDLSGVDLTVANCVADGLGYTFVYTLDDQRNGTFTITDNRITNITATSATAFNIWDTTDYIVTGNYVDSINYNEFNLDNTIGNITFTDNIIKTVGNRGLQIAGCEDGDILIDNNHFENIDTAIRIYQDVNADSITITNNEVMGVKTGAITLAEATGITSDVSAMGNTLDGQPVNVTFPEGEGVPALLTATFKDGNTVVNIISGVPSGSTNAFTFNLPVTSSLRAPRLAIPLPAGATVRTPLWPVCLLPSLLILLRCRAVRL